MAFAPFKAFVMKLLDILHKLRIRFIIPDNMTFDLPNNANVGRLTLVVKPLRHDCLTRHISAPSGAKTTNLDYEALINARDLGVFAATTLSLYRFCITETLTSRIGQMPCLTLLPLNFK